MKSEGSNDIEKVLIENSTASAIFHFSDIFSFSNRNESSDESWEASCMRVFSTLMSHTPVKRREQELHGVVMRVEKREFVWESVSTLMPRSNENKSCMRVDDSWLDITARVAKTLMATLIN
jgi:hypothetical protein